MAEKTRFFPTQYVGDGIELSQDPHMRAMQLRREAERLERKAAKNDIYAPAAKEARVDYERFIAADWSS
jgi:hypothetical protein